MYMWRAVDSEGEVLEILVQPQRDKAAALRLLRKLIRRQGFVPTVIVTDKLRSYGAAPSRNWLLWIARARTACQQNSGELASAASTTKERCKASNQSSRLSVLFPSMRPFTTHSMYNDI